jgi:hypothetical protein
LLLHTVLHLSYLNVSQYLSTPESQSLRCDLIRYICAVIHPSNEVLCSDIIPRWAVIGWLLTTCTVSDFLGFCFRSLQLRFLFSSQMLLPPMQSCHSSMIGSCLILRKTAS